MGVIRSPSDRAPISMRARNFMGAGYQTHGGKYRRPSVQERSIVYIRELIANNLLVNIFLRAAFDDRNQFPSSSWLEKWIKENTQIKVRPKEATKREKKREVYTYIFGGFRLNSRQTKESKVIIMIIKEREKKIKGERKKQRQNATSKI